MPKLSPVSYKQLVKVFEAEGFICVRTEGDHVVFTKPGVIRPVVVPKHTAVPVSSSGTTFELRAFLASVISNSSVSAAEFQLFKLVGTAHACWVAAVDRTS
jgi:predicted RNA binding protein YcfA (HicA-like mRNA interferase family)